MIGLVFQFQGLLVQGRRFITQIKLVEGVRQDSIGQDDPESQHYLRECTTRGRGVAKPGQYKTDHDKRPGQASKIIQQKADGQADQRADGTYARKASSRWARQKGVQAGRKKGRLLHRVTGFLLIVISVHFEIKSLL